MPLIVTPGQLNQRAELYHQLGSMLSAGVPLVSVVEQAQANLPNRASRSALAQIHRRLLEGETFAQAMGRVGGWSPAFDTALLSAGEMSGRLDLIFKSLAGYYKARAQITRDAISEMMRSILTIHVFCFIFPLHLLIQGVAKGLWGPFVIQKIAVFGLLYGVTFLLAYACQGQHGEKWRMLLEGISRRIPFLGKARQFLSLARLSASLEALINAGVSIIAAWELSAIASGSTFISRAVARWRPHLESGTTPAELVNQSKQFPSMFANLYQTGENSGQQDDTLRRLHAYYEEEGFRKLRMFTKLLNGIIYLILVLMVARAVFGFYLGRLSIIDSI